MDLVGEKFNGWTVVRPAPPTAAGRKRWHVRCDCGLRRIRSDYQLRYMASLGCRSCRANREREDLSGKRFGKWTVLHLERKAGPQNRWICACDCGTIRPVHRSVLRKPTVGGCHQCQARNQILYPGLSESERRRKIATNYYYSEKGTVNQARAYFQRGRTGRQTTQLPQSLIEAKALHLSITRHLKEGRNEKLQ